MMKVACILCIKKFSGQLLHTLYGTFEHLNIRGYQICYILNLIEMNK